jgi:hypothetical protein
MKVGIRQSFVNVNKLYYKNGHDHDCVVRVFAMLGLATPSALQYMYAVSKKNTGLDMSHVLMLLKEAVGNIREVNHLMSLDIPDDSYAIMRVDFVDNKLSHIVAVHMRDKIVWIYDPQLNIKKSFSEYILASKPFTYVIYTFTMTKQSHKINLQTAKDILKNDMNVNAESLSLTEHTPTSSKSKKVKLIDRLIQRAKRYFTRKNKKNKNHLRTKPRSLSEINPKTQIFKEAYL